MSESRISSKDVYGAVGVASLAVGSRTLYKLASNYEIGAEISQAKTVAGFLTALWVGSYTYSQIKRNNDIGVWTKDRIGPYYPKPGDPIEEHVGLAAALELAGVTDISAESISDQLAV